MIDEASVADFAYTILATFNSLAYHLYDIEYKGKNYACGVCDDDTDEEKSVICAVTTKLENLKLKENDKMMMEYDFGATNTFKIKVMSVEKLNENEKNNYPKVVAGEGLGMLDDIDKKENSDHYFTPRYETCEYYDYREFDIEKNNLELKKKIEEIKFGYEHEEEKEA